MGENEVINDLGDIRVALLDIDIPSPLCDIDILSPTVPEYIEHHKQIQQIQQIIALVDEKMAKYRGKEVTING